MSYYLLISVACLFVSTYLFYKAAGTLNPGKINIISCIYYLFICQTFIGAVLIQEGYRSHYTVNRLIYKETSCNTVYVVVMIVSVLFPLSYLVVQKIMKVNIKCQFARYLSDKVEKVDTPFTYCAIILLSAVCLILLMMLLVKVGYIPLLYLIHSPKGFDFSIERIKLSSMFIIHPYITTFLVHATIPLLSYITFVYAIVNKTKKWVFMAVVLFGASIVVKTFTFAKTPLIFHLAVYVLIYIYCVGGIRLKSMLLFGAVMGIILIMMYRVTGYEGSYLDIYNGPLGRTLFTQVGTLMFALELFPEIFPFLGGRSFTPTILKIIGMDPESHLRSARLVMDYYGSEGVYDGIAGVMNTVFFGEAYANWGYKGIIISLLWVAFITTLLLFLMFKMKKTPSTVAFLAVMTVKMGTASQGGFVDFIYNSDWLFTGIICLGCYFIIERENKFNVWLSRKFILDKSTK